MSTVGLVGAWPTSSLPSKLWSSIYTAHATICHHIVLSHRLPINSTITHSVHTSSGCPSHHWCSAGSQLANFNSTIVYRCTSILPYSTVFLHSIIRHLIAVSLSTTLSLLPPFVGYSIFVTPKPDNFYSWEKDVLQEVFRLKYASISGGSREII